jgi:hypothetical protein
MRTRKPTKGRVTGAKFAINKPNEETDLKKVKAQLLKELAEKEQNKDEWYDAEMERNLNKK